MSRPVFWNDERCEEVTALRKAGLSPAQIAARMGVNRTAVSGIIFRLGLTEKRWKGPSKAEPRPSYKLPPRRLLNAEIKPSLTPFAPDDTCPDFAWDEQHCAAVLAEGGYVALNLRRAA
jgi:hypothetical protein